MKLRRFCLQALVAVGLLLSPIRGQGSQCQDKYRMIPDHTACLPPSRNLDTTKPLGVALQEREEILKEHNTFRGLVQPPAANMQKMVWDEELGEIAQLWAENCIYHHDDNGNRRIPGRFAVGQNLAINYKDWKAVVFEWYIEHRNYQLGKGEINPGSGNLIGHYVQLAYATAARIGCGIATCNHGMKAKHDYVGTATIYVCNYAFGVTDKEKPYKEGSTRCEHCPGRCVGGLCDCGGKVCENGGTLDLISCTCTCKQTFAVPEQNCGIDCGKVKDSWFCTSTNYPFSQCLASANLPDQCPEYCQVCPWGGFNYTDGSVPIPTTPTLTPTTSTLAPTTSTLAPTTTTSSPITTAVPPVTTKPMTATASPTTAAMKTSGASLSTPMPITTTPKTFTPAVTQTSIAMKTSGSILSTLIPSTLTSKPMTPTATQTPAATTTTVSPVTTVTQTTSTPSTSTPIANQPTTFQLLSRPKQLLQLRLLPNHPLCQHQLCHQ